MSTFTLTCLYCLKNFKQTQTTYIQAKLLPLKFTVKMSANYSSSCPYFLLWFHLAHNVTRDQWTCGYRWMKPCVWGVFLYQCIGVKVIWVSCTGITGRWPFCRITASPVVCKHKFWQVFSGSCLIGFLGKRKELLRLGVRDEVGDTGWFVFKLCA